MDGVRVLLLCAALLGLSGAFSHQDVKDALLQNLGLDQVPHIHKRDLENLVIPARVKNKYSSLLKVHGSRMRRSVPSLAGILRGAPGSAGILRGAPGSADVSGEFVYSDATRHRMVFNMEARIPENSEVTMAELKLYQRPSHHKRFTAERRSHRPVSNAMVSIYWVEVLAGGSNRTALVDSRLVPIHETGWKSFDVTQAVHYWSKMQQHATLMHLEVWIEPERPGSHAAEVARSVRFTTEQQPDMEKPELVLYTLSLEEYGSGGDCDVNPKRGVCCREQYFIDFSSLTWTQYWIIEPAGYQAFRCTGGCKQPQRSHGYGERRCVVSESSTLPIMYLVKKEDHTEIEVAEFPNMIVEKCACMLDNVSLV